MREGDRLIGVIVTTIFAALLFGLIFFLYKEPDDSLVRSAEWIKNYHAEQDKEK
jgi:hypothetical protein